MPENSSAPVALLMATEAARILKTTPATIRRRMQAGLLPALPSTTGPLRFALTDVLALANRGRQWNVPSLTAERHMCLFVREPEHFSRALRALIAAPLAAGGSVVLALDRVQARLGALLADPLAQRAYASDRLRAVEASVIYLSEGHFDDACTLERLAQLRSELSVAGCPWMFVGEMGSAAQPGAAALRYEASLDRLVSEQPLTSLVCVYDASRCDGETALAVLQTHPLAWIDDICQVGRMPEGEGYG